MVKNYLVISLDEPRKGRKPTTGYRVRIDHAEPAVSLHHHANVDERFALEHGSQAPYTGLSDLEAAADRPVLVSHFHQVLAAGGARFGETRQP